MDQASKKALLLGAVGTGLFLTARALVRHQRAINLRGKVVLVTGGSRGLGLVMARQLVQEGALVAICARDAEELEQARRDLQERGGQVLTVPCDLTDQAEAEDMVRQVQAHYGRIDVLINNAGVIQVGPIDVMTVADFEEAMKANYWGAVYTTLAALPDMRRRKSGRIVNISSIGGKISIPHLLPYSASKFALTGFSEGLRAELAHEGILVTTICPHLMRTGSPVNAYFKGQHRKEYAWFSVGDALPLFSISAESAARRILTACKRGEAEVILTLQANLAAKFNALFPSLTGEILSLVDLALPGPGGIGTRRVKGKESYSPISPSPLTALSDRAAVRNNENP